MEDTSERIGIINADSSRNGNIKYCLKFQKSANIMSVPCESSKNIVDFIITQKKWQKEADFRFFLKPTFLFSFSPSPLLKPAFIWSVFLLIFLKKSALIFLKNRLFVYLVSPDIIKLNGPFFKFPMLHKR